MGPLRDALCLLEVTFEAAEENPTIKLDSWGKGDGVLDKKGWLGCGMGTGGQH